MNNKYIISTEACFSKVFISVLKIILNNLINFLLKKQNLKDLIEI